MFRVTSVLHGGLALRNPNLVQMNIKANVCKIAKLLTTLAQFCFFRI
jgi:hypothetical protein